MRRLCAALLLLALQAPPEPSVTAAWLGDDALRVTWSGPPGACLYYERPDAPSAWLTCEAGTVVLHAGGDATTRPVAGARLWVAGNTVEPALAATWVPWRVALPDVRAP